MPVPAAVVSVKAGDSDNLITISWIGVVCSIPPMIGFSVRENRYSYELLEKGLDFAVNIPGEDHVESVDICGKYTGRGEDKFELSGLTRGKANKIDAPLIAEYPVNLECVIKERHPLGSHTLYIGEIVDVHIDESMIDSNGIVNINAINPISYIPKSGKYYKLGEALADSGFSKRPDKK